LFLNLLYVTVWSLTKFYVFNVLKNFISGLFYYLKHSVSYGLSGVYLDWLSG